MPDTLTGFSSPTATHGANPNAVRGPAQPSGLPIFLPQMDAAQRETLRQLGRTLAIAQSRIEEALATGRLDRALGACSLTGELGVTADRTAITLGGRR